MTISTDLRRSVYTGNSIQRDFPFNFRIDDDSELQVSIKNISTREITIINPSQYAAFGFGEDAGGYVTYPLGPVAVSGNFKVYVERFVPYTQNITLLNQGGFFPQVVEDGMDRLEMQIQQLLDRIVDLEGLVAVLQGDIAGGQFLFLTTTFGAVPDGMSGDPTDNTAAIQNAINTTIALGAEVYVGPGVFYKADNVLNFHSNKFWGPGAIKTGADIWYITPNITATNTLYTASVAQGGLAVNDGLTAAFPIDSPAGAVSIFQARAIQRSDGGATVDIKTGSTFNQATNSIANNLIRVNMWRSRGGKLLIKGPNPDPTDLLGNGWTDGLGVQPLVVFDGLIDSQSTIADGVLSTFPIPFPLFVDGTNRKLRIFQGSVESTVDDDDLSGLGTEPDGLVITYGPATGDMYLTPTVTFYDPAGVLLPPPVDTVLLFDYAYDTGATCNLSKDVEFAHIQWKNFSTTQCGAAGDTHLTTTNVWRKAGTVGQKVNNRVFWENNGGMIEDARRFGIDELFEVVRSFRQVVMVRDAFGRVDLAKSRARGLTVRNCRLGHHAKEHCTGHVDYTKYLDNEVHVFLSRSSTMNISGTQFFRSSGPPICAFQGSFFGGGFLAGNLADFGYGTVNANATSEYFDRTSGWITNETSLPEDIEKRLGAVAGRAKELKSSFPRDAAMTAFTTSDTGTTSIPLIANLGSVAPGAFTAPGAEEDYLFTGKKTGAAGVAEIRFYVGPSPEKRIFTIPANATWFEIAFKLRKRGVGLQNLTGFFFHDGTGGLIERIDTNIAVDLEANALMVPVSARGRVANAADSLIVTEASAKTMMYRVPDNAE
jgi:hypothetical protein